MEVILKETIKTVQAKKEKSNYARLKHVDGTNLKHYCGRCI